MPHNKEVEPPFGVRIKFLYEFSAFYFICSADRETDSDFSGLSSNQWTGIIVSSLFGFSKSRITSFTNFVGYPALMNDCLMAFFLLDVRHLE